MKMKQKLIAGAVALSAMAGFAVPAAQAADVSASVSLSNMYYWRGYDLGGGAAATADINVSASGFTAGMWTSSGDGTLGTEYDLYAGFAGSVGKFTYGVSLVSYNYANPVGTVEDENGDDVAIEPFAPGDYMEVVPTIGYGPFTFTYYDAVAADHAPLNDKDYAYWTADLALGKFDIKYGQHMSDGDAGVSHLDVTYAYNDNLSFTVGQVVDDQDGAAPNDTNVVVTLSLPLK